jgi:NADH-quinone oxidoreductase subunit J
VKLSNSKVVSLTFFFFMVLGALAIGSAVFTIASRNPVASAIGLVFHFFMLAGLYLTLQAQFLAAIQVLVYAGAIMVLVVFVIMLLNLGNEDQLKEKFNYRKLLALIFAAVFVVQFLIIFLGNTSGLSTLNSKALVNGTAQSIGSQLFVNYLFPFEAIYLLLIAAIVGSVLLAKRNLTDPKN